MDQVLGCVARNNPSGEGSKEGPEGNCLSKMAMPYPASSLTQPPWEAKSLLMHLIGQPSVKCLVLATEEAGKYWVSFLCLSSMWGEIKMWRKGSKILGWYEAAGGVWGFGH